MPVRIGFTTTNRYTRLVGLMRSDISATLKSHISRLNGSMGSGTDLGRTTTSAATNRVLLLVAACARANTGRHNVNATSTGIFKSSAFQT